MSRRSKRRHALANARTSGGGSRAVAPGAVRSGVEGWNTGGYHPFEAAKRSGYRGYFYFPSLEPKDQMPQWTRQAISEKVNWLYNNVGAVRAVVDGLSLDEVDTGLWPKAMTSNEAFNAAVTDAFDNEGRDPRFFHSAGNETVYSAQLLIRRSIRLHGEIFGQLLRPETPGGPPMMHFVDSWQCRNATTDLDQKLWREGQRLNRLGRVTQYRFVTSADGRQFTDVSADDVLHFHGHFWNGQTRGVSTLAPVVRKLFSIDDIERAEASGTLLRSRLAYAITRKDDGDGGGPALIPGASDAQEIQTPDGGTMVVQKVRAMGDGGEVDIASLHSGMEIKVIESARAQVPIEFTNHLLTDVAHAELYPPGYVFWLAGVSNGTLVRMLQKRVQRVKNTVRQFQIETQFLSRWYVFWLWQRIASGAFDQVGVPADWWKHKIMYPADDTVDVGREGRLYDERVSTGRMDPDDYHALTGKGADDVAKAVINDRRRKEKLLKEYNAEREKEGLPALTYADLWPASQNGAAMIAAANASAAANEEEGDV